MSHAPHTSHRPEFSTTALVHVALFAGFVGLFASGVLSVGHLLNLPIPCGTSRGCVTVAAHPASKIFGVPIALFGMAAYCFQLLLVGRRSIGYRARWLLVSVSSIGTLVSAGLLGYSQWVIEATCPWCVVSGAAMVALLASSVWLLRRGEHLCGPRPPVVWTFAVAIAVALGLQAGRMERSALSPPISAERLATVPATELLDPMKSIGPSDASVTIILFGDFLCPSCRSAMASLLQYQTAHSKDVRLVYRHRPLSEIQGHETSKAAAALSEMAAERGKFWAFVDAFHAHRGQMNRAEYLELMRALGFDPAAVEARLNVGAEAAILRVQRDIDLAERLDIHATPTFIVQAGTYAPVSATERGLKRLLNSPAVVSLLMAKAESRVARN